MVGVMRNLGSDPLCPIRISGVVNLCSQQDDCEAEGSQDLYLTSRTRSQRSSSRSSRKAAQSSGSNPSK